MSVSVTLNPPPLSPNQNTIQYIKIQYNTIKTLQYSTIHNNIIQNITIQYNTLHYITIQCYTIQYIKQYSVLVSIIVLNLSFLFYVLFCLPFCWCPCMAINVSVRYDGGFLPDIILLTQCYYHRGTRLNAMKRFCIFSY